MMTFKKDSISGLFYNKKFVSAFSLIAAFVFWLVITINQNPERTRVFSDLSVSVTTENTAAGALGLQVIEQYKDDVSVKVSGPSYVIASLSAADISISYDISDVTKSGEHEIDLSARCNSDSEVKILSVEPARIKVKFDYFEEKNYKILPEHIGVEVSDDSGLSIEAATFAQSGDEDITISGPRSEMDKIASVRAAASVNSVLNETTAFDAKVELFDVEGKKLDSANYTLSKSSVKIIVPIYASKNVPVVVVVDNKPSGKNDSDILSRQSVKNIDIKGNADLLANIGAVYVNVNYNEIKSNSEYEMEIKAPSGTKFADNTDTAPITIKTKRYQIW